jgi:hypothetical protein
VTDFEKECLNIPSCDVNTMKPYCATIVISLHKLEELQEKGGNEVEWRILEACNNACSPNLIRDWPISDGTNDETNDHPRIA